MGLFSWLAPLGVSPAEVRAEVWSLGVRHHGEPLKGALDELRAPSLSAPRAALLRACVAKLRAA